MDKSPIEIIKELFDLMPRGKVYESKDEHTTISRAGDFLTIVHLGDSGGVLYSACLSKDEVEEGGKFDEYDFVCVFEYNWQLLSDAIVGTLDPNNVVEVVRDDVIPVWIFDIDDDDNFVRLEQHYSNGAISYVWMVANNDEEMGEDEWIDGNGPDEDFDKKWFWKVWDATLKQI
jgi:hypothetical protein